MVVDGMNATTSNQALFSTPVLIESLGGKQLCPAVNAVNQVVYFNFYRGTPLDIILVSAIFRENRFKI